MRCAIALMHRLRATAPGGSRGPDPVTTYGTLPATVTDADAHTLRIEGDHTVVWGQWSNGKGRIARAVLQ